MSDIRKVSTKPEATILRQGHTSNGKFGSEPMAKVRGSNAVRDLNAPSTGRK